MRLYVLAKYSCDNDAKCLGKLSINCYVVWTTVSIAEHSVEGTNV